MFSSKELRKRMPWFILLNFLNISDAVCTLVAVSRGATELNPLMAWLLAYNPAAFVVIKFSLVWVMSLILLFSSKHKKFLIGAVVLYIIPNLVHIFNFLRYPFGS